jgi:hypothetical protein
MLIYFWNLKLFEQHLNLIYLLSEKNRSIRHSAIKALSSIDKTTFTFFNVEQGWIHGLSLWFILYFYIHRHKHLVKIINYIYTILFIYFFLDCKIGNPCDLNTYRAPSRGFQCIQKDANTTVCTCPGGLEENKPCCMKIK